MSARWQVIVAVTLQSLSKVAYGTWLVALPTSVFVFFSFTITALFFLAGKGTRIPDNSHLTLVFLNVFTAITFLSFFQALKFIEPAVVSAIEIGIGPIFVVALVWLVFGSPPKTHNIIVGSGILAGCVLLMNSALRGSGMLVSSDYAVLGILFSLASGIGAVVITMLSKQLSKNGWSRDAILAHRFYLIVLVSFCIALFEPMPESMDLSVLLPAIVLVSVAGVLVPLYLLQSAIGKTEPYVIITTMALLPVLTFLWEFLSPRYQWSLLTAIGVLMITVFLVLDVWWEQRQPQATVPADN